MNQRDEIVNAIAKAGSLQEQANLVAALDEYDRRVTAGHAEDRAADWADMAVTATLTPVAVHERSTIETDWLGEVTASTEDVNPKIIAEAAAWFGRVSPEVKADPEEFSEQARGIARRTASAYGDQAPGLEASFLEYVEFLNRRTAASGLDQVQQVVDSHENPKPTDLPQDVFDTFGPPVHPINQGVSGTETSERNPLINEIESEGGGGSTETHHDTTQQFSGPAPVEERPGVQGTTASIESPLFAPTVGLSHTATLVDFMPGGRFHVEASQMEEPRTCDDCGEKYDEATGDGYMGKCPECADKAYSKESRKQAASGLPQVQQTVDAITENPAPTPLPEEVAFPWGLEEAPEVDERSDHKASIEQKRAMALAYLRGLVLQPTAMLTEVQRLQVAAYRKHADQWTQGQPQYHGPDAANSPYTTPEGTGGTYQQGYAEGASDRRGDEAPTFADVSSAVPPFVQGHSEGYQEATPVSGATPGQMPPGAGGFDAGYQTHAASLSPTGPLQNVQGGIQAEAAKMNCTNCGRQDNSFNMTIRGNGNTQQAWCSNCKPVSADHGVNDSHRSAPMTRASSLAPKTSSLFVTAIEQADPDFAKAYKYASTWTPGKPLVRRHASKVAFEAGLYAGITDNPEQQRAWVAAHMAAGDRYKDNGFNKRIALHTSFTEKVVEAMPDLRRSQAAYTVYVERPEPEPIQATAATSLDLDTASPSTSPSPTGQTPINGPGTPPPLQGGTDPAAPGGPAPYNGAPPYGSPVVTTGPAAHGQPLAIDTQPGAPVDAASYEHLSPQTHAFRQRVQASLLAAHTQQS